MDPIVKLTTEICQIIGVKGNEDQIKIGSVITEHINSHAMQEAQFRDTLSSYVYGQPSRNSEEAEKMLISGIINKPLDALALSSRVTVDMFYDEKLKNIYEELRNMNDQGLPITKSSLEFHLDQKQFTRDVTKLEFVGGPDKLNNICKHFLSLTDYETYVEMVINLYTLRKLVDICCECIDTSYSVDYLNSEELRTRVFSDLGDLGALKVNMKSTLGGEDLSNAIEDRLEALYEAYEKDENVIIGTPSCIYDMNKLIGGYQPGDLIVVAGRPGMGKTAYALSEAAHVVFNTNRPVIFFSLEMTALQLSFRLLTLRTGIYNTKLKTGGLSEYDKKIASNFLEELKTMDIFIDDTPAADYTFIRDKCVQLKRKHGDIGLIVVDYIQLMSIKGFKGNREQEVNINTQGLKDTAKIIGAPVMALAQLSRAVEIRGGAKRPMLSDLRESGAIEQHADIVAFTYRPEYYQMIEDAEGNSLVGVGELIVAKQRNGALNTVKAHFNASLTKWEDLTQKSQEYTNESIENTTTNHVTDEDIKDDLPF